MRKFVRATWGLLAVTSLVQAAPDVAECVYRDEPAAEAARVEKDVVKVLSTTPAAGGDVREDTVIGIDVEYHVTDFAPDKLFLFAMFPTRDGSTFGPGDHTNTPALKAASGKVHLCTPLREIYANVTMRWPLTMRVMLIKMFGRYGGSSPASSDSLAFNALDPPEYALAPRVDGPDDLYQDALKASSDYLDQRAAGYKACLKRFPEKQPAMTKAYRGWETRHRADIELVAQRKFERDKVLAKGRSDVAANYQDATAEGRLDAYDALDPATLKRVCDRLLEDLSDPDDPTDGVIGDYMKVLRSSTASSKEKMP